MADKLKGQYKVDQYFKRIFNYTETLLLFYLFWYFEQFLKHVLN